MEINIGVSNRHVHLTKEDYFMLFGNYDIKVKKELVQTGEYASTSIVSIKTEKNIINNVRVLGPYRNYTQVEISKTDSYVLGISPPVRNSGEIEGSSSITIVGPKGEITREGCIIAARHLHINHEDRIKLDLLDKTTVSVKVGKTKTAILNDVQIKESEQAVLELHLDTDDANSNLLKSGDLAEIII